MRRSELHSYQMSINVSHAIHVEQHVWALLIIRCQTMIVQHKFSQNTVFILPYLIRILTGAWDLITVSIMMFRIWINMHVVVKWKIGIIRR